MSYYWENVGWLLNNLKKNVFLGLLTCFLKIKIKTKLNCRNNIPRVLLDAISVQLRGINQSELNLLSFWLGPVVVWTWHTIMLQAVGQVVILLPTNTTIAKESIIRQLISMRHDRVEDKSRRTGSRCINCESFILKLPTDCTVENLYRPRSWTNDKTTNDSDVIPNLKGTFILFRYLSRRQSWCRKCQLLVYQILL